VFPFRLSPDGKYITKPDGVYTFPDLDLVNKFPTYDLNYRKAVMVNDHPTYDDVLSTRNDTYSFVDWSPNSGLVVLQRQDYKKWMVWDFMSNSVVYLHQQGGRPYCFVSNNEIYFDSVEFHVD
jgi:hypothetical protein